MPHGHAIDANHMRAAAQVREIRIVDEAGCMVCISRLTMAVVKRKPASA
jgi:hypothetical protein